MGFGELRGLQIIALLLIMPPLESMTTKADFCIFLTVRRGEVGTETSLNKSNYAQSFDSWHANKNFSLCFTMVTLLEKNYSGIQVKYNTLSIKIMIK